jgi:hypothetical protein
VNGKVVARAHGRRITVRLRHAPHGRVTVRLRVTLRGGRHVRVVRRFRGC